ncbi:MAG: neutral/alkaline non-lysosomal ceramidase N-terminal domain-containing protein [Clostridia bacterium]|nr:neutral/alkaline non-lysosomal ceramidase N-terminal domain-containing protein [Clostridia bacterium]
MEKLFLGVAREIITPEVGGQLYGYRPDVFSESVADDLTVTAFYFKYGNTQALMLSATVCLIQTELSQRILSLIEQNFGIPKKNCMLSATHTHSGPNTAGETGWGDIDTKYCDEIFIPAIRSAVEKATNHIQPVKMGTAHGTSLVGINRREITEDNETVLGQNPWGCFNPKMTVISFADLNGNKIANIVHYGAHGTAAGANHEISRDWSGIMIDTLEKQSGALTAFFNGPEGDVGPRLSNKKTVGDLSYVRELGAVAARDAVGIFERIHHYTDVAVSVSHKKLQIPLKKRISVNDAGRMLEIYKDHTVNLKGMIRKHLENTIQSYKDGFVDQDAWVVEQTIIALGDLVFVSFPYELFSEIGMRIDKAFQTKSVLSLSNTNGSEGYFITQDAICRGGYEVRMFLYGHIQPFCDDADFALMQETVNHIKNIRNESEE